MFFKTAKFVFFGLLVLLAIFSLFPYLPPFKGFYKIRAVMSGSMEKAVPKGSLILNQWSEDKNLKIGDIITYRRPDVKDFFITHRIISKEKDGLFYFFKTQGDQVSEPDKWRIGQSLIEGKVIFTIPLLGYLYVFVQSLPGFLFLIFLPAVWLIFEEIKNIKKELKKQKNIKMPLFLLTLALFSLQILPTYAYFSSDAVFLTGIDLATKETWADSDPPESSTEILPNSLPQLNFNINFSANDNQSDVAEVKLYYSRDDWGGWIEHGTPQTFSGSKSVSGSFSFNSPLGEGYYRFLIVAKDSLGNLQYDLDKNGISEEDELYPVTANSWTVVDITAPVTVLSVDQPMAIANDRIYNGGFENGNLDGWVIENNGGSHQATQTETKAGVWSALVGNASSDSLSKNLTLAPVTTSTLSFWYRLLTSDNVSGGTFDATVKSGTEEIKVVHDGWDDSMISETDLGWKNVVYQLNNLVGQNVDLQFKVSQPDDLYKTWVYLDEIRVTADQNLATTETDINLLSHDGDGSGVNITQYRIDNGSWQDESGPLNPPEGTHKIDYRSTDAAGNVETEKQIDINVSSAPVDFGVVLNEFSPSDKWVELYNNSQNPVDVSGWQIKNSAGIELGAINGSISSQEKLKIENINMNEAGDSLILLKSDNTQVDSFTYAFSTPGKSFKREPDGTGTWKDPEIIVEPDELIASESGEIMTTASPSATVQPSSVIILEPTATPSATPEPTPLPTPTIIPTPELTVEPTPELTVEPTPELTVEPTPSPTPEATPEEVQN